ncbi:MAG: cytochrome c oxidase subunit II [Haloferacaceae archaeon]
MRRTRPGIAAAVGLVALALFAEPVAAQSSVTAGLINDLNAKLLYVAIPITLVVELILLYTVVRFKDNDEAVPTRENRRLEITWTIATAFVLLFVGVASYGVLANENVTLQESDQVAPENDDVVVTAEAYQWGWNMRYPEAGNFTAPMGDNGPQIVIPKGQDVYFRVTSTDVLHAFHVPELGLKQDAIPGQTNTIKTVALETGTYQGYCAEYCGVGHSRMYFTIKVVSQQQYDQFVAQQQGSSSDVEPDDPVVSAADE